MTYTQALLEVLEVEEIKQNVELSKKLQQLFTQLDKKNGKLSKSEKAKQEENEKLKDVILLTLCVGVENAKTIKQLQKESEELEEFSNQKISALLRQLIESGEVERVEVKRQAQFFKPKLEQEENLEEETVKEEK